MSFGNKQWAAGTWVLEDEDEVVSLLQGAYDRGLNTWDTANVYSNGRSEELIGLAIRRLSLPRHKLVLLTKCFGHVGEKPEINHMAHPDLKNTRDYVNQGGLSRTAIFNAVNASLKRLDTDYIDLLQIHRFDSAVPVEETMEALHDLVKSGKVRYIGASSMWAYQFAQMQFCAEKNGWTKFVSMQNHYSLCYREEEREMNKFCRETGVGLIPWAPLCRGYLARPPSAYGKTVRSEGEQKNPMFTTGQTESDQEVIRRVQELAEKHGWKMSHVALAWIEKRVSSPIIGFSSVERMDEALEARGVGPWEGKDGDVPVLMGTGGNFRTTTPAEIRIELKGCATTG